MKTQHIYILAAVLAILIVLTVLSERPADIKSVEEQVDAVALMPASISPDAIMGIELRAEQNSIAPGAEKSDEKPLVRLERQPGGGWVVATAYDAPAKSDKIDEFLKSLNEMKGLFVSDNPERFDEYQVSPEKSIQVRLFTSDPEKPVFGLHVGKKRPGGDETLVRVDEAGTVYAVGASLRSDMGVWSDADTRPGYSAWLDKKLVDLDQNKVRKIELTYPDHSVVFEKVQKLADTKDADAENAEGDDVAKADTPPEYEWRLLSRSPGGEFKKSGLDNLLRQVSTMEVQDVLDPAKKEEFGLDEPAYRLRVELDEGEPVEIVANRDKELNGGRLILLSKPGHIWELPGWRFDATWKAGKELFDLETPTVDKKTVRKLSFVRGKDDSIMLVRDDADKEFKLIEPQTGFDLKQDKAKAIAEALSSWQAYSYADPAGLVKYGFSLPACRLSVGASEGEAVDLILGSEHPGRSAWYIATDPKEQVLVMEGADKEKVFPELSELLDFSKPLVSLPADSIQSITVNRGGDAGSVTVKQTAREVDGKTVTEWVVEKDGATVPADKTHVAALKAALTSLKAASVRRADDPEVAIPENGAAMVTVQGADAKMVEIVFGPEVDKVGRRPAKVTGWPLPLLINKSAADALLMKRSYAAPKPDTTGPAPRPDQVEEGDTAEKTISVTKTIKNPFE